MTIRRKTPLHQIMKPFDRGSALREKEIIRRLAHAGEQCLARARNYGSYEDRSGKLRSSIGYAISRNGRIVSSSGFDSLRDGEQGAQKGRDLAKEAASGFTTGTALIVVAGMGYAAYMESQGYDVLTSSEMLAEKIVPGLLKTLGIDRK